MQLLGLRSWVLQISGSFSDVMSLTFSLQLHHSKGVVFHTPTVCNVIKSAMATQWIGWNKVYSKGPVCRNWEGLLADTDCNTHVSVFISIQSTKTNCCAFISFKRAYQLGGGGSSTMFLQSHGLDKLITARRKGFPHTLKSSNKVRAGVFSQLQNAASSQHATINPTHWIFNSSDQLSVLQKEIHTT